MDTPQVLDFREKFRATASLDSQLSSHAREALAQAMAEPIRKTLDRASTVRNIYTVYNLPPGAESRFPLDLLFDEGAKTLRTWVQPMLGGMPQNFVSGMEELFVPTFDIAASVEWRLRYAREARIDIVARAVHKMVQSLVRKEEDNGWTVLLHAIAANTGAVGTGGIVNQDSSIHLSLQALNAAIVAFQRLNTAVDGGTPANGSYNPTDIYLSYENMSDVRGWTYQALNQYDGTTSNVTNTTLDDTTKREIFAGAGLPSVWGLVFHPMAEFGLSKSFNTKFDAKYTSASVITSTTFATATRDYSASADNLCILLNLSAEARPNFIMPVKMPITTFDDPVAIREGKQQVRAIMEEGWALSDDRYIGALILNADGA